VFLTGSIRWPRALPAASPGPETLPCAPSIGSRRRSVPSSSSRSEGVEESPRLVAATAQNMEGGYAPLITAHDLAINQAGAHLEVVHGLDDQREASRPVIAG
jgi:hypothetical protein